MIDPISYFGYEGLPSRLAEPDRLLYLANVGEDVPAALNALADELNAPAFVAAHLKPSSCPLHRLTQSSIVAQSIGCQFD